MSSRLGLAASLLLSAFSLVPARAQDAPKTWEVPMGGNSYLTQQPKDGDRRGGRNDSWSSPDAVTSVYFRVDRAADLDIVLRAKVPQGESRIRATLAGKAVEKDLKGAEASDVPLGRVSMKQAGYVKVDLQGIKKTGDTFADVEALEVTPVGKDAAAVVLNYVKDNKGNNFYWGRRGPSIHLGYELPKGEPVEWFYNEITVPVGSDPIGSYFMSNGFGEGYFGMQVNGPEERRVLFSVWSPFKTDHPGEIPEDQKITLLKKGTDVHGGEFGGEGSGGQSYWKYAWKAGNTYRFLNRVHPDGKGSTVYTAWFFVPEKKDWQLIASFKRPQTDKHYTGAHSFLENFSDRQGFLSRGALYGNQWCRDVKGEWHEVTTARFTTDPIGRSLFRMDYAGGSRGKEFFMRNGGFFAENVKPDQKFTREPTPAKKPVIDFSKLEGADLVGGE
ncbi:DUF3472 domain-containing protein [Luteolibacter ambystomatis]|uniref:DUF3472 domain-containing protein n=1 Tax=Luteolibacter ambystomatis TaxID=2824561 RepID=A0A975G5W7_9BACT|nr:DUF3472 domain-containing protein [Luteolibacter ambystomatis]QUE49387.1 DUF3472 domain-containing protein [Luteolibacter ambystomatis]